MNIFIKTALIFLLISLSACRQGTLDPEKEEARILNEPSNRTEATILMQAIDLESEINGWSHDLTKEFRQKMKSRLLSAGLKENEIDKWTES